MIKIQTYNLNETFMEVYLINPSKMFAQNIERKIAMRGFRNELLESVLYSIELNN